MKLTWRDLVGYDQVAVIRQDGVSLLSDWFIAWDIDALASFISDEPLPTDTTMGYHLQRRRRTSQHQWVSKEPSRYVTTWREARAAFDANMTRAYLSEWTVGCDDIPTRIGATAAGTPFCVDERLAVTANWLQLIVHVTQVNDRYFLGFYPFPDPSTLVGITTPSSYGYDHPVWTAIGASVRHEHEHIQSLSSI